MTTQENSFGRGIAVCGLGRLGAPVAAAFAASDVPVIGLDVDEAKVRHVNERRAPTVEPDLQAYLDLFQVRNNLRATADPAMAVASSDACIFVTPTPSLDDGNFNHDLLLAAVESIAQQVRNQKRRNYLFIVSSTVAPKTMQKRVRPVIERHLGRVPFLLAYKPEFIALGTVLRDLHYADVMLIGEDSEEAGDRVEGLYRLMALGPVNVRRMSLVEAELAKISLNCAVTMKISFANQVGLVARRLGADPHRVLAAVACDKRIGPGALRAGLPYGGPCFPRDNRMFRFVAATYGVQVPLAIATDVVNKMVLDDILENLLGRGGAIGILGLAYKPGTPVLDESPGRWWLRALTQKHRTARAHDPVAPHPHSLEDVLSCQTVVVATAWPEYESLTLLADAVLIDPFGAVKEVRRHARARVAPQPVMEMAE